jgi:hypothetical protein
MRMPLPTRLFGALLLSTSSRFETRPDPTRPDLNLKFFFSIDALAHSPISAHSLISDSKHNNSLLKIFFLIDALPHSSISTHSLFSDSKRHHNSLLKIFFLSTPWPIRPSRPILLFRIRNDITTLSWNFFSDRRLSPSRPILLFRIRNDITTLYWNFFLIDTLAHSPISAHSLISDSKRHHNSLLNKFFFDRRLSPIAHLGPFSYLGFETTSQLSVENCWLRWRMKKKKK